MIVFRDITERRRLEVERESQDRIARELAAIVETSDDAIVSKDLESTIRSWNQGAERIFGYAAEEMVGRSIRTIIPEERWGEEDEVLRQLRQGNRVDHFETIRRRKDGTEVAVSLTISPIRSAAGVVIGASKIARDITDRKEAEAERSRLLEREQAARAETERYAREEKRQQIANEVRTLKRQAAGGQAASLASRAVDGVVVERVDGLERDTLRDLALALRDKNGLRAVVLATAPEGGGAALVAAVTPDSGYDASALLEEAKKLIKGGGGKDPLLAVAGGKDADGIDAALVTVRAAAGIQGS